MSTAHTSDTPKRPSWGRRIFVFLGRTIRNLIHLTLRLVFALVVLLIAVFSYLHFVGLPAYLSDLVLAKLAQSGYHLQVARIHLELDRGLVAQQVRGYIAANAPEPFIEAEELAVALHPMAWIQRREWVPILAIQNGTLRARLGRESTTASEGSREIAIERIHMRFTANPNEILLSEFTAEFLGIQFRGRGTFSPSRQPRTTAVENPLTMIVQAIEQAPEGVLSAIEQANQITFRAPPTADFTFAISPDQPAQNTINFRLVASTGGQLRGVDFDRFNLEVALKKQQVHVNDLHIQQGTGILGVSGWMNLSDQMTEVHLVNTLSPSQIADWLPLELQDQLTAIAPKANFPVRLELKLGPTLLPQLAEQISGRLELSKAMLREVPIERLNATFERTGNEIKIPKATIQLEKGPFATRLQISDGTFHLESKRFEVRAAGGLNPQHLLPVIPPHISKVVTMFGIREPLQGEVTVGGTVGNPAIYCYGPVHGTNFTINGELIQAAHVKLDVTNEVLHLRNAVVVRPEGSARGNVQLAFSNQTLRLEQVEGIMDVKAVSKMIGPFVENFMQPFQFNGPVHARVNGLLDYCNMSLNHLDAHITAQNGGYMNWETDLAEFDLAVRGRRIRMTNITATAYGGQFAGKATLYPVGNNSTWRYEVDFSGRGASLSNLLSAAVNRPIGDLRGTVDGNARIGGTIGDGMGPTVTGAGHVKISDGLLFQTKLFSGLSTILSKILPGFTLFAQTDATGNFTIQNSRVYSRDVLMQGTVFSAKGTGNYTFAGELDFRAEVQLLRGGPLAALVRLATLPVTRLLEFRLTGTFAEPRWRPINFNPSEWKTKPNTEIPPP